MGILGAVLTAGGAIIGGAVGGPAGAKIGASLGGAVGGAVSSSSSSKNARSDALASEQRAREAYLEANNRVNAVQANYLKAGEQGLNALNGRFFPAGSTTGASPSTGAPGQSATPNWAAYGAAYDDLSSAWEQMDGPTKARFGNDPNAWYAYHYETYGQKEDRKVPVASPAQPATPGPATPAPNPLTGNGGTFGTGTNPTAPNRYQAGPPPAAYVARPPPRAYVPRQARPPYERNALKTSPAYY